MDMAKNAAGVFTSPCIPGTGARDGRRLARPPDQGTARRCGGPAATGTIFYWRFEDWTVVQALYFSVVTLTTVGFGDFAPTTAGTQIFTIIYILTGLGVLVALLSSVAQQYLKQKTEGPSTRERIGERRHRHQAD
jgi:Ion channel